MNFEKHKWWWIAGAIFFYLWYQGSLAAYGLPSAWFGQLLSGSTTPTTTPATTASNPLNPF